MDIELLKLFFPEGVLDIFTISTYKVQKDKLHFFLEENNDLPEEFKDQQAVSKGFLNEIIIEDFPLRGKEVFLHVKRRRWTLKDTGEIIKRNWKLRAEGMKMTAEFADFLKGIS